MTKKHTNEIYLKLEKELVEHFERNAEQNKEDVLIDLDNAFGSSEQLTYEMIRDALKEHFTSFHETEKE